MLDVPPNACKGMPVAEFHAINIVEKLRTDEENGDRASHPNLGQGSLEFSRKESLTKKMGAG